jgi:hypothetical protein
MQVPEKEIKQIIESVCTRLKAESKGPLASQKVIDAAHIFVLARATLYVSQFSTKELSQASRGLMNRAKAELEKLILIFN